MSIILEVLSTPYPLHTFYNLGNVLISARDAVLGPYFEYILYNFSLLQTLPTSQDRGPGGSGTSGVGELPRRNYNGVSKEAGDRYTYL